MNFIKKTWENPVVRQLFSYLVVGGIATVVEWVLFYLFSEPAGIHYLLATALAFILSTFANWLAGRALTFRHAEKQPILAELAKIYAASVAGLGFNLALMCLFVDLAGIPKMVAKVLATAIVFAYNFLIRKFWIYRKK